MAEQKKEDVNTGVKMDVLNEMIAKAVAQAVGKAIEETLPIATMAAAQAMRPPGPPAPRKDDPRETRCHICGQYKKGCNDQHVKMYVGPTRQRFFKDFPGRFLNGVHYKSPSYGAQIDVPAENDFAYAISQWEDGEETLRDGRQVFHNSGTLSGNPSVKSQINPANPFGFSGTNLAGNPR